MKQGIIPKFEIDSNQEEQEEKVMTDEQLQHELCSVHLLLFYRFCFVPLSFLSSRNVICLLLGLHAREETEKRNTKRLLTFPRATKMKTLSLFVNRG